jgi:hypothetical protein
MFNNISFTQCTRVLAAALVSVCQTGDIDQEHYQYYSDYITTPKPHDCAEYSVYAYSDLV